MEWAAAALGISGCWESVCISRILAGGGAGVWGVCVLWLFGVPCLRWASVGALVAVRCCCGGAGPVVVDGFGALLPCWKGGRRRRPVLSLGLVAWGAGPFVRVASRVAALGLFWGVLLVVVGLPPLGRFLRGRGAAVCVSGLLWGGAVSAFGVSGALGAGGAASGIAFSGSSAAPRVELDAGRHCGLPFLNQSDSSKPRLTLPLSKVKVSSSPSCFTLTRSDTDMYIYRALSGWSPHRAPSAVCASQTSTLKSKLYLSSVQTSVQKVFLCQNL